MKVFIATAKKDIFARKWSLITYCIIGLGLAWLYIAIFPTFSKESAKFNELLATYPKSILEAFNISQLKMDTLQGFMSAEHFSLVWPAMAILLAISTAGQSLSGEIESGTMALLLSLPVSRLKLFWSKYMAGMIVILLFTMITIFPIVPLAHWYGVSFTANNVWLISILSFCFAWAIYSLTFLFSAIFSERSHTYFVAGGIVLLMYVVKIMSGMIHSFEKLKYASAFYYYQADKTFVKGSLDIQDILVFCGVAVIATAIALIVFLRRDVSV
ncbi:MAG: ABC transporter permease subunit [Candidatus Saccharibacteria bacterium]